MSGRNEELARWRLSLIFSTIYESPVAADPVGMTTTQTGDGRRATAAILGGRADETEIARVLAVAFALATDHGLKETLRSLSGAPPGATFAVSQPSGSGWLTVEADRVVAERARPEGVAVVEEHVLRTHGPMVARTMAGALAQTTALAEAAKLIRPLLGPGEVPSRREFAALLPWAPALEQVAYKTAASIAVTLDLLRPYITAGFRAGEPVRPELLRQYWQRMHASAQFFLLSSDTAASIWLGEMARQFDWMNWTPTFTLLRERTTWLAACAARSAGAFGEPVVQRYLAKLEAASHPFKIFDAVFGLTAIALGNPDLSRRISGELRLLKRLAEARHGGCPSSVRRIYDDALDLIEGRAGWARVDAGEIEALGWTAASSAGLATGPALRTDPAIVTQSGHLLGFIILPTVFATPIERFNPVRRGPPQAVAVEVIEAVLRGAWGGSPTPARVLH